MVETLKFGVSKGWKQIIFGHIGRKPEGSLDKVAKRVGAGDIQTGDAELDQRLKITGQPEDEIRGLLTSMALRERLLAQPRLDVRLNQGELRWRTLGVERDSARLRDALDLLSALATGMERG
jgi:hypothetical protein